MSYDTISTFSALFLIKTDHWYQFKADNFGKSIYLPSPNKPRTQNHAFFQIYVKNYDLRCIWIHSLLICYDSRWGDLRSTLGCGIHCMFYWLDLSYIQQKKMTKIEDQTILVFLYLTKAIPATILWSCDSEYEKCKTL